MTLYKRGNVWWVEYVKNGVRHRKSCGTTKKIEAQRWVDAIKTASKMPSFDRAVEVLRDLFDEKPVGTIALTDAWKTYENLTKAVGKDKVVSETMRQRKIHLKAFVRWLGENAATIESVEGVTGQVAASYASHLVSKGIKSKTRINTIADLSCVWKLLSNASRSVQDVWAGLRPRNTDGERIPPFTAAQERKVLESAKKIGKEWYPICVLARNTGLRYEDCALLERSEVDLKERVIRLNPEKTKRYGVEVVLPIIDELYEALKAVPDKGVYYFPLHEQWYGDNSQTRQRLLAFREVLEDANLYGKGFTFHSFRHTAATNLAMAGVGKELRKAILGHITDAMAERYDHSDHLDEKRKAMEAAVQMRKRSELD